MLVQTYFPHYIAPARYDHYLASGWFRGANMLYKTDLLCLDQDVFSVVNIRLDLKTFSFKKSQRKLLTKNDKKYTTQIRPFRLDQARERLYGFQKKRFKGFIHQSLKNYLNGGEPQYVFNTFEVAVYDDVELVAWSCFDLGEKSLASLLGLHHPDYHAHSLGTYTMLKEMEWSQKLGYRWYYPGYVLDRASSFNYKLRLGDFQYYNQNERWVPFKTEELENSEAQVMRQRVTKLEQLAKEDDIACKQVINPYFTMAYMNNIPDNLEGYPLLVEIATEDQLFHLVFDTNEMLYALHEVEICFDYNYMLEDSILNEYDENPIYAAKPYRLLKVLKQTKTPEPIMRSLHVYLAQG